MKTDRLRRELSRLDSVEAPELLPEIAHRIELGPVDARRDGPGFRTSRVILAFGVVAGVVAGLLVLARVLPTNTADREPGTAGPIPENAIVLGVLENGLTRLYVVEEDGSGFTDPTANGSPVAIPGFSVNVSPDASRATFVRAGAEERGVWVARVGGSGAVRLTEATPNGDENPVWSPDGGAIAFSRNRVGHHELFKVNADGSNLMQITSNDVGQDVEPAWSPDGSSIVFTRNSGGPIDLWIVNVDGSVERQLTRFEDQSSSAPSDPDWSPDGSRIVFAAAAPGAERKDHRDPPRDLWVIDADGTNLTRLTDTPQDEIDPSWSPDGEAIAFLSSSSQVPAGIDLRGPYSPAIVELSSGTIRSLQAPMGSLIDTSLQWLRPGSVDTPEPMPAEVIYIDCTRGDTRISSQTVLIQPDGVHFSVTGLEDAVGVWGSLVTPPGEGTWAFEVDSDHPSRSMVIAPGSYFVACWHEGETDNRFGPQRDGVQLDIIHPGTPLHLEAVAPTLEREKLAGALGLTPHEWTIGQTLEPRREGVYLDGQIPEDCAQQEDDVVIVQQVGDGTFYCARGTDAFQARMMGQRLIGSTPTPQAIRDQRMNEPRPRIGGWPEDVDRDGLISDAGSERIPELIRAAGDGGVSGYIRYEDLEGPQPADPAQAVEISGMPWTIPLYAEDGVTIIDRYTLNAG